MSTPLRLGVFGFGCVGQGLYKVLHESAGIDARIRKICIKDPGKERPIDPSFFTTDPNALLSDPDIDVIVELIDDAEAALEIVRKALENGKSVVSANKKMIAENLPELLTWQVQYNVPFLYEASSCASIPIIRNLEEYYDNDMLTQVEGIFNGSTNFILSQMAQNGLSYNTALEQAQRQGFAETDPYLDVAGVDAKYKLCILLLHAFGKTIPPQQVFNLGITALNGFDLEVAQSRNCTIKLLARCFRKNGNIHGFVMPHWVPDGHLLAHTHNEYNAVILESAFSEQQALMGKGAGDTATGTAVLSDISALRYGYRYEYRKKAGGNAGLHFNNDCSVRLYLRTPESRWEEAHALFSVVEEEHIGRSGRYLLGTVSLEQLCHCNWLRDPGVSAIALHQLV